MQTPPQITFLGLDPPDSVESLIRQRASSFERFADRISSCHVVVDMPHHEQREGTHYSVRIYITTVNGEVTASRNGSHHGLHTVIGEAFAAAASELDTHLLEHPPSGVDRKPPSSFGRTPPSSSKRMPPSGARRATPSSASADAPSPAETSGTPLALPITDGRRTG